MLNPIKVDKFFKTEKRLGRRNRLIYMKLFSVQQNNCYNRIQWKTEANVKTEIFRQYKDNHWYIINPFSVFSHIWDTLMIPFYVVFIYVLPLRLAVLRYNVEPLINISQIPVDLFFLISIPINFFTAHYDSLTRTVTYSPSFIAKKYVKGFFLVDLLSSLPYDACVSLYHYYYGSPIPNYYFIMYIFYYLKILRFGTFLMAMRKLLYFIRLRGLVIEILSIVVVWFTISYLLLTTLHFFSSYQHENRELLSNDPLTGLIFFHNTTNFIFTLSNKLTQIPKGSHMQVLGQLVIIFTTILVEPFVGAVVIVLYWSTRDSDIKFRAVVDEVESYTNALTAPDQIKKKIKDYFKVYHNQSMLIDDKKAIGFYTGHDQMQIMSRTMDNIVMKVKLFGDLPSRIRLEMVKKLKREVLFTGYYLTIAGQVGSKMYIVSSGKLLIYAANLTKLNEAGEGSSLGEYQLLADSPYPFTSVCAEITTVYSLDRNSFNSVIFHLSDVYVRLREKITERHMNIILALERLRQSTAVQ